MKNLSGFFFGGNALSNQECASRTLALLGGVIGVEFGIVKTYEGFIVDECKFPVMLGREFLLMLPEKRQLSI